MLDRSMTNWEYLGIWRDASGDGAKQKSVDKNLFPVCLEQSIRQLYQAVVIRRPVPWRFWEEFVQNRIMQRQPYL